MRQCCLGAEGLDGVELLLQDVEPVTPREEAGAVAEDAALNISSLH